MHTPSTRGYYWAEVQLNFAHSFSNFTDYFRGREKKRDIFPSSKLKYIYSFQWYERKIHAYKYVYGISYSYIYPNFLTLHVYCIFLPFVVFQRKAPSISTLNGKRSCINLLNILLPFKLLLLLRTLSLRVNSKFRQLQKTSSSLTCSSFFFCLALFAA